MYESKENVSQKGTSICGQGLPQTLKRLKKHTNILLTALQPCAAQKPSKSERQHDSHPTVSNHVSKIAISYVTEAFKTADRGSPNCTSHTSPPLTTPCWRAHWMQLKGHLEIHTHLPNSMLR